MLKVEPLQGDFDIKSCNWVENKGLFGNIKSHKINEWETKRFRFPHIEVKSI